MTEQKIIPMLEAKLSESVVRHHKRGTRRYFPIKSVYPKSWPALYQAFEIIYGRKPENRGEVGTAILFHGLDSYIERIDGKLWVRTIYKVDWKPKEAKPLLRF